MFIFSRVFRIVKMASETNTIFCFCLSSSVSPSFTFTILDFFALFDRLRSVRSLSFARRNETSFYPLFCAFLFLFFFPAILGLGGQARGGDETLPR